MVIDQLGRFQRTVLSVKLLQRLKIGEIFPFATMYGYLSTIFFYFYAMPNFQLNTTIKYNHPN